jgi:hypothetical protein
MDIEKVKGVMDANGDLEYSRIFDDLLPTVGDEHFYAYLAARACSYMTYLMVQCNIEVQRNWKPRYYKPDEGLIILTDHITRFYGCQLARSNDGFPSIDDSWSTRDPLEAIGPLKECMPRDAFRDMYRCMHFNDDFDEESPDEWSDVYFDKKHSSPATERHRKKFSNVEDTICQRWKEYINFGMWVTFDESRVAGWYNSAMTIGPEPKPIRTDATIHSLCVSKGDLAGYKLHARTYGRASDKSLCVKRKDTVIIQKFVTLLDTFLDAFKGKGHCVTMDSTYMGDTMGQIGREEWKINMVGTAQTNRTGAPAAADVQKLKVGTYESIFWLHRMLKNLCYVVRSDNDNKVKTLSNFHSPDVLEVGFGMLHKMRVDGKRDRDQSEVPCPVQMKDYCETFHLIDKGNCAEAHYGMGGKSRTHNWSPKLVFRLWNMSMHNAYIIYSALHKQYTPDQKHLSTKQCVKELTFNLLQRGDSM